MGITRHGSKCRHRIVIDRLDAVSRTRALSLAESLSLEHAIKLEGQYHGKLEQPQGFTPSDGEGQADRLRGGQGGA